MMKVLIFEPHPYHFEVLISSVYYFKQLGYITDLLVRENFNSEDVFSSCNFGDISIDFFHNDEEMINKLSRTKENEYDFIFFNSMEYWRNGKKERILDFIGFQPESKFGILGIYHNLEMINKTDNVLLEEKRIFALTPSVVDGYDIPMFAGCYFGEFYTETKLNNNLIFVGLSNDRCLIEKNLTPYNKKVHITVLGKISPKKDFIRKIAKKFINIVCSIINIETKYKKTGSILGFLRINYCVSPTFSKMYQEICESNYIGIVMDLNDEITFPFLHGKTSGSKQLVLGFNKPCLINSKLCDSFKLNPKYCITFDDNDIASGLEMIQNISFDEYKKMQSVLCEEKDRLIQETKNALRETIMHCMKGK